MENRPETKPQPSPDDAPVFRRMRERRFRQILDHPPECTMAELRKSLRRSQQQMAEALGVKQIAVSRLERRRDMHLSSLHAYVTALGGDLQLIVRLPYRAVRLRLQPGDS